MGWVNTNQLEIHCYPGLKGIAIPVPDLVPTTYSPSQPTAHLSYNPVGNFGIREADRTHPNQSQAIAACHAGSQFYAIAQYQAAQEQFHKAATLLPRLSGVYYAQALCWLQQGNFSAASQVIQQELQLQPTHLEAQRLARKLAKLSN